MTTSAHWARRAGAAGFLFFFLKGMAWLVAAGIALASAAGI